MAGENNITVHEHITTKLRISFTGAGCKIHEVTIHGEHGRVYSVRCSELSCIVTSEFPTGHYIIKVKSGVAMYQVHSVVPAICRLSAGGCGFLVNDGDSTFLLTANHCIPDENVASATVAHFETLSVKLEPETFWKSSPRYCAGGLDFTCVGLSRSALDALEKKLVLPHRISEISGVKVDDVCILTHFNYSNSNRLLRTACKIDNTEDHCIRYTYLVDFPSSSGGSSGSPLFGFNTAHKLCIMGLHIGKGKGTSMTGFKKATVGGELDCYNSGPLLNLC